MKYATLNFMLKKIAVFVVILGAAVAVAVGIFWKNIQGLRPALAPAPQDIAKIIEEAERAPENSTGMPLSLPPGFSISVLARDLPGARVMALDRFGNMWVSQTKEGKISLLEIQDGKVTHQDDIFQGLHRPHGLAFDPHDGVTLYYAEEDKISRVTTYSDGEPEKIIDLPKGDGHFTRTLGFGPDDRLYVSIGSSCDVCHENDPRRAKIFSMAREGSDFKEFARGLRNAVFFTWSLVDPAPFVDCATREYPSVNKRCGVDGRMWATEMGRDWLGDDAPPDEIDIVEEGKNYGWPICYGKNIHDTVFDKNTYIRNPCMEPFETPSYIDIPAHSAPLGLAFIPESVAWPQEYWHNLLVAYHGSWNKTEPTGYKVVRVKLDEKEEFLGFEDFITGWLTPGGTEALGRPVDILASPDGSAYISDDKAGVIYKISYKGGAKTKGKEDLIRVASPKPGSIITSPLEIRGEARGIWFFEASFPVRLLDGNGSEIVRDHAEAESDWMTENFVPFRAILNFRTSNTREGTLILEKDNPSGLPENDDELRIPIRFR